MQIKCNNIEKKFNVDNVLYNNRYRSHRRTHVFRKKLQHF